MYSRRFATRAHILTGAISLLALFLPHAVGDSSCCGGGGGSTGALGGHGGNGLLDLQRLFQRKRLRVTIHPGTKEQDLQVRNYVTGQVIATIPIPASPGTPIGRSFVIPRGGRIAVKILPSAQSGCGEDEGSEIDCQAGGGGGTGATVTGQVEGSEECPPPCEEPIHHTSGVEEPTPEDTDQIYSEDGEQCGTEPGEGDPDNDAPGGPGDGDDGGGAGDGGTGEGGGGEGEADTLYESLLNDLKRSSGAARVNISLGSKLPTLNFTCADLAAELQSATPNWRQKLSVGLIPNGKEPEEEAFPNEICDEYSFNFGEVRILTDEGTKRIRSIYLRKSQTIVTIKEFEGELTVEFAKQKVDTGKQSNGDRIYIGGDTVSIVNGYFSVADAGSAVITPPPYCAWTFSKIIEEGEEGVEDDVPWLRISRSHQRVNGVWIGKPKVWKAREFIETPPGGTEADAYMVSRLVDDQTGIVSDYLEKDGSAGDVLRGKRITRPGGAISGWKAIALGNQNVTAPPSLSQEEEGLTKVYLGGAQNTVWQWSTNGMLEKTTVGPALDAPQRTVTVLRPWGNTTSPTTAQVFNSHAVTKTIHPLQHGRAIATVESVNGSEVKWTVDTQISYLEQPGQGAEWSQYFAEVTQRFPNGFNSVPSISYSKRHPRVAGGMISGRPIEIQDHVRLCADRLAVEPAERDSIPENRCDLRKSGRNQTADGGH